LGRARAGPGLGRAAPVFYSVKQLKTAFRAGLGPKKNFAGFKISAHALPVKFVGGPGADRAGPDSKCSGIEGSGTTRDVVASIPSFLRVGSFNAHP
jgi:hypothetical protein